MSAFSIIPRFPLGGKMGERSLYETATQEVITMYNDEFNNNDMYRFTNREMPRDDYAPAPRQENTYTAPVKKQGFFRRTWVKVTALVLACVVAGGAAGYGGAALAKGGSGSGTAISESDRTVTAVEVKKVDGTAKFTGEKQLEVTKPDGSKESMTADAIIVATGSVNAQPPIPGLKENPNCIDSTGALSLDKLPATMVVIGGGVIGLELACAYAAFGTKITVVEAMDHMLPMLDGDLTKIGVAHMKKMGMEFHLECPVQSVEDSPVGAKVVCKDKSGNTVSFEAEKVLVAIGRKANTAALDLAAGKIDNDKGRILVNDKMETSVSGVYAIGDCVFGHAQLAHTASAMGEVAAENICGHEAHYCEKTNPTCVYMEPEAASVGLTEEQCKAQGIAYKVGKFPMSANGKALILNGGEGLVKIIAGAEYGEILGMHIIGPRATDLIAEGALAIGGEMTLDELIDTIHSHPTVTETMREAALNAEKRAIHTKN